MKNDMRIDNGGECLWTGRLRFVNSLRPALFVVALQPINFHLARDGSVDGFRQPILESGADREFLVVAAVLENEAKPERLCGGLC